MGHKLSRFFCQMNKQCTLCRSQPHCTGLSHISVLASSVRSAVVISFFSLVIGVCRSHETTRSRLIGLNVHVVALSCADRLDEMRSLSTPGRRDDDDREKVGDTAPNTTTLSTAAGRQSLGNFVNKDTYICIMRYSFSLLRVDSGLGLSERSPDPK